MDQRKFRAQNMLILFLANVKWLFLIVVVIVSFFIAAFSPKAHPLDKSTDKAPEIVGEVEVVDSLWNGFRVWYNTTESVTKARLTEIQSRPALLESWEKLTVEAPAHFGNMLYTDIYEFAAFAIRYDTIPEVRIHNIFVMGPDKEKLYVRPNPKIPESATWINPFTSQGLLYLSAKDFYYPQPDSLRVYRYWKCKFPFQTSDTDEHFAHFSEAQRLY